jgi:hypothetical protein
MYFQIFRSQPPPAIPPEVTYTVEHLVGQILTTAAPAFLQAALERQGLAQALFEELEFFGQVPKRYLPDVKTSLIMNSPYSVTGPCQPSTITLQP